ncbi:MAG: tautomerase family protein [Noviherbaspirillum sp.]
MPYLQLQTIKGLLSPEQKIYLMGKFTELPVEVGGGWNPEFKKKVWIKIEEREPEHWQLGDLRPTADLIDRMVALREAHRGQAA